MRRQADISGVKLKYAYAFLDCFTFQESDDPYYVTLLASQTTHRAVLAGDMERAPTLCDNTSEFIEEAVR